MAALNPYVVPALTKHTATVIMAHGLGDRYVSEDKQLGSRQHELT